MSAVDDGTCVSVLNTPTAADIDAGSCVQTHARDGSVSARRGEACRSRGGRVGIVELCANILHIIRNELAGPWTNIQVEPSLPFPYSLSPSASSLLLILPHPFPSSLSLFPTLFFPFPPSPVLITARVRGLGSAIAPPAGRPPNAFLCNLQSKNCKSVKSLTHVQMS